ncbi:MAG: hypothetical protein JSV94_02590 [Methanobacteriota archaeon]|nr:MAG: hypothetical protein JSV94_02590 [Euryarchaeota archaeon]
MVLPGWFCDMTDGECKKEWSMQLEDFEKCERRTPSRRITKRVFIEILNTPLGGNLRDAAETLESRESATKTSGCIPYPKGVAEFLIVLPTIDRQMS